MDAQLTPLPILETLVAYQRSAALASAIELDLFTHVGDGATLVQLAARSGASERGTRSLCDYLVVEALLTKSDGGYGLTPIARQFLDRRGPSYVGSIAEFLHSETLRAAFGALTASVRRGSTAVGERGTMDPEHPVWRAFARGMAPMIAPQAEELARRLAERGVAPGSILDVAAGHGLYAIACAKRWPRARATLADWGSVLEVALENARAAGVLERVETLTGDATEIDLRGPYDLVLVPNFLHHFDFAFCERFLRRVHAATSPGGTLAVVEFLVAPDRVSPPPPARFSLVMIATTPGGDSFTEAERRGLLQRSGFRDVAIDELVGFGASAILARR
jgi:ubiquinone/menaquinone biosynthesis C-methylase UbiE